MPNALRALAALCLLSLAPCARAITNHYFTFTQGGYEFGARVEGSLYLRDENDDGMILDDGPLGDSLGGHMTLIGHPTYEWLFVSFYAGWSDIRGLGFSVRGDSPWCVAPQILIRGYLTPSSSSFSGLPGGVELSSNERVIMQRVPDNLPLGYILLLLVAMVVHRRRKRSLPGV